MVSVMSTEWLPAEEWAAFIHNKDAKCWVTSPFDHGRTVIVHFPSEGWFIEKWFGSMKPDSDPTYKGRKATTLEVAMYQLTGKVPNE